MTCYYLFTRANGNFIAMQECRGLADEAEMIANDLRKRLNHEVVVWTHVGGNNDTPEGITRPQSYDLIPRYRTQRYT